MIKISFPRMAMKKGKGYELPVNVSGLPLDLTSFMLIVTCDKTKVELDDYSTEGTLCENEFVAFNNSPTVFQQPKEGEAWGSCGVALDWLAPYNRGCAMAMMSTTRPVAGKVLVNMKVWAMDTGTPKFKVAYFNIGTKSSYESGQGTIDVIGSKPPMLHFVDGTWSPYVG